MILLFLNCLAITICDMVAAKHCKKYGLIKEMVKGDGPFRDCCKTENQNKWIFLIARGYKG